MENSLALLRLLQLCNSSLPVGAYSYSEGIETLCEQKRLTTAAALENWLAFQLAYGSIQVEVAVMLRGYRAWLAAQFSQLAYWNAWYTASRETEELLRQSLQMGHSLLQLLLKLEPNLTLRDIQDGRSSNYCLAYGLASAYWQIDEFSAALGYFQSWAANLVNAGVKLIPLGQTQGQQVIANLGEGISQATQRVLAWEDDDLESNSWGLQLASMEHEILYSRIFRS
jgi:urease accessory protein